MIDRLIEIGELDDARFARRFAEDKRELAGWGPERIREALLARGVAREQIEAALAGDGADGELERAGRCSCAAGADLDDDAAAAGRSACLARRGYDVRDRLRGGPPRRAPN